MLTMTRLAAPNWILSTIQAGNVVVGKAGLAGQLRPGAARTGDGNSRPDTACLLSSQGSRSTSWTQVCSYSSTKLFARLTASPAVAGCPVTLSSSPATASKLLMLEVRFLKWWMVGQPSSEAAKSFRVRSVMLLVLIS